MFEANTFYQNDPTWKDVPLGFQSSETIGTWGCLTTSITMALNGLGFNETPDTVNAKMKDVNGFMDALIIPAYLPSAFPGVVFKGFDPCESSPAPIAKIDAALAANKPVIVQVDWNPEAGIQTHWVLLKEKRGDTYTIYDPYKYKGDNPSVDVILTERYKYQGSDASAAISGVIWLEGSNQAVPPKPVEPTPVPSEKFTVYVAEDDLAMRAAPSVAGYLMQRLPLNSALISLESKDATIAKLGKNDQWLHVQDAQAKQGYVAAWYMSQSQSSPQLTPASGSGTPSTTPTPASSSTTPASGMIVAATEEGLTMRSMPVIAPETQIAKLPIGTQLTVVEAASDAVKKIGVQGAWIKVRDANNRQGYVAAWYVKIISGAPSPQPAPAGSSGAVVVKGTAADLALRSQPVIADTTLIARLPLGASMTLLDASQANLIGQANQWLKVKDSQGREGYVAAWYVQR